MPFLERAWVSAIPVRRSLRTFLHQSHGHACTIPSSRTVEDSPETSPDPNNVVLGAFHAWPEATYERGEDAQGSLRQEGG